MIGSNLGWGMKDEVFTRILRIQLMKGDFSLKCCKKDFREGVYRGRVEEDDLCNVRCRLRP